MFTVQLLLGIDAFHKSMSASQIPVSLEATNPLVLPKQLGTPTSSSLKRNQATSGKGSSPTSMFTKEQYFAD